MNSLKTGDEIYMIFIVHTVPSILDINTSWMIDNQYIGPSPKSAIASLINSELRYKIELFHDLGQVAKCIMVSDKFCKAVEICNKSDMIKIFDRLMILS